MKRVLTVLFTLIAVVLFADENVVSAKINYESNEIEAGKDLVILVDVNIKDGWHINSAKVLDEYSIPTQVSLESGEGFSIKSVNYPEGEIVAISWGGNMSLYEGKLSIPLKISTDPDLAVGLHVLKLKISYQACNNATCMSPDNIIVGTDIRVLENKGTISTQEQVENKSSEDNVQEASSGQQEESIEEAIVASSENDNEGGPFRNKSLIVVLMIVFVMGLALNLTPCVYPLIPITMGYFLAQKESRSPVLLAVMYVLGLAITYSIIGTLAAFGGSMMGSLLAHPATLIFFAALMLALSLSMFGLYEFKLPDALTQVGGGSRSGAIGALIMGLTMGIVAAPCVGPFVVSLLSFVAQSGSVFIGFITFFFLALGLGLPYLFLGIFSNKISALPRSGEWLNGVRIFFGLALIGMSIYFVKPLLSGMVSELLLPVYMIAAAVYYGVIDSAGLSVKWFSRFKVILAMLALALGILMLKPVAAPEREMTWENYSETKLELALEAGEPVIIDFYADWCNPCKELEHITFTDPAVQEILEDFVRFKVNLTVVNDSTNAIKGNFEIPGVPTILFYDEDGIERKDLRLNGFEKPGKFVQRLQKLEEDK